MLPPPSLAEGLSSSTLFTMVSEAVSAVVGLDYHHLGAHEQKILSSFFSHMTFQCSNIHDARSAARPLHQQAECRRVGDPARVPCIRLVGLPGWFIATDVVENTQLSITPSNAERPVAFCAWAR